MLIVTIPNAANRMSIRGSTSRVKDMLASLPGSRWHGASASWVADATPAAAHRLLAGADGPVQACEATHALAARFLESTAAARAPCYDQPPIRKFDAWRHQAAGYHFANRLDASYLAMGMGTGKSKVVIDLLNNRGIKTAIVVCPVAVLGVWRREFARHSPIDWSVVVLDKGSTAKKTEQADDALRRARVRGERLAVIVSYDAAKLAPFADWSTTVRWDAAILDEAHRAKGATTNTSEYVGTLGRSAGFRLCLSGTPMPHSPLDVFGQFRFLDRGIFGTWWHHFRNRYAISGPIAKGQIVGYKNLDELESLAGLITYSVGREVLDLPEATHNEREVELSAKSRKIYRELERELIAEIEHHGVVAVPNALVKLLRLQQLTSGYAVPEGTEDTGGVEIGSEKRDALAEILEDLPIDEPIVVFCRFRHDLDVVRALAKATGRRYGELSGRQRDLTPESCMRDDVDLMGVQIQSGGVGIDLTRAAYAIYFSIGFSLGDYDQSLARLHRPGQTRPVRYYHLIAENTVDRAVYGALRKRANVVEAVLEGMKR